MEKEQHSLISAFAPILVLVGLLVLNGLFTMMGLIEDALDGFNQMALVAGTTVAAFIAHKKGFSWNEMLEGITKGIGSALSALIILLLIGALAGTWLLSGIVPAMIYYGLEVLNPTIFLFAACVVCAVVSLATGSSWSTVGTVGIALLGIGKALGFSEGLIAGAIISGAYFGDKMSPLSDTTNLAPAMAGTDLITHIKYMTYTTIPSIAITLIIFLVWGFFSKGGMSAEGIDELQTAITSKFSVNPLLFLVPFGVIVLIARKVPAIPALFAGTLLGGVFAVIFQPDVVHAVSNVDTTLLNASYISIIKAMTTDISVTTSNEMVNELLATGGMQGMLGTIWLIICAMSFGGIMEHTGMLRRITKSVIAFAHNTGSLIGTTAVTCLGFNLTAGDQYLAIVVPGRMYAEEYKERGLAPEVLSRTLEDSGTVTSALIPWNTCGAFHAGALHMATIAYAPYAFFNIISPIMTVFIGAIGYKIKETKKVS